MVQSAFSHTRNEKPMERFRRNYPMSQHYIYNEAGPIPGILGTFANCQVTIDDAGNLLALPLAQHPAFEAAPKEAKPEAEASTEASQKEAEAVKDVPPPAPPEETQTIVQE